MNPVQLTEIAPPSPEPFDAVAFGDFVLCGIVQAAPCSLLASLDHSGDDDPVRFWLENWDGSGEVLATCKVGQFRAVLARWGHFVLRDQLHAGYSMRCFDLKGERVGCSTFMSNQGQSGFWLRVHAVVLPVD